MVRRGSAAWIDLLLSPLFLDLMPPSRRPTRKHASLRVSPQQLDGAQKRQRHQNVPKARIRHRVLREDRPSRILAALGAVTRRDRKTEYVTALLLVVCRLLSTCNGCAPQSPCTTCAMLATVADRGDCTRYFTCSFGRVYAPQKCNTGIYSETYRTCVAGDPASCGGRIDGHAVSSAPSLEQKTEVTTRKSDFDLVSTKQSLLAHSARGTGINSGLCGVRIARYIVGGAGTTLGDWPWQASLRFFDPSSRNSWHFCGATLVSSRWVMTAAHCVHGQTASSLEVIAGASSLYASVPGELHIRVKTVKVHPGFANYGNYPNDIALLELLDSIAFDGSNLARPACLPEQDEKLVEEVPASPLEFDAKGCWVTGWGATMGMCSGHPGLQCAGTGPQYQLNKLKQNIVDQNHCRTQWASYVQPYHICVGDGSTGACRGDSGGPLVCSKKGRFYLEGVVSWGEDTCLLKGYPNIATRVSSYRDWIDSVVGSTQPHFVQKGGK